MLKILEKLKRYFKKYFLPTRWLFLDDIRNPPGHLIMVFDTVRSYDEFVEYIEFYGVPKLISFDHDLDREHTMFFFERGGFRNPPNPINEIFEKKTGYDCALWLIEYCESNKLELPYIIVHSRNPLGSENIYNLISGYRKKTGKEIKLKSMRWVERF